MIKPNFAELYPVLSTFELCQWLGIRVTVDFLIEHLQAKPAAMTSSGAFWFEHDIPSICQSLSDYFKGRAAQAFTQRH